MYTCPPVHLLIIEGVSGNFADLDFGSKLDGSTNLAFEPQFNSFGHFVQGFFVVLLFPVVWPAQLRQLRELASVVVVVYPMYNTIKRAGSQFAVSSYANNGGSPLGGEGSFPLSAF